MLENDRLQFEDALGDGARSGGSGFICLRSRRRFFKASDRMVWNRPRRDCGVIGSTENSLPGAPEASARCSSAVRRPSRRADSR